MAAKDKPFYLSEIKSAVDSCRSFIQEIDKKDELWKIKLGILQFAKKKELEKLNKEMSFEKYLDIINDLKIRTNKQQAKIYALVNNWKVDEKNTLDDLGVDLSGELGPYKQNCNNAVNFVKNHIAKRGELLKK